MVESIIEDALATSGTTPGRMKTAERMKAVPYMYERGLFQIPGSVELVSKSIKISKFTIYAYLDRLGLKRPSESGAR
ncbi:helix-turn-helix domain-containing protein [Sphingobium sp.]|uniref:helix-turn-helix domain-containing protein n=1 Tax=Sphingobium sp. TaxID=1912891 RepID=UPI0039C9D190